MIFLLELELFAVGVQKKNQNSEKWRNCFCEELLSENDFEAVLINYCCDDYGANASAAVRRISARTLLELCQLIKTANFIAAPL